MVISKTIQLISVFIFGYIMITWALNKKSKLNTSENKPFTKSDQAYKKGKEALKRLSQRNSQSD